MTGRPWDRAAIAGVGFSTLSRRSGKPVLDLALDACRAAVHDAGLAVDDVDGIASFSFASDSAPAQAVATGLALPRLDWVLDASMGGQAPCYLAMQAALAIGAGLVDNVLVFRALNGRSGARVGQARSPGEAAEHRYMIQFDAYAQYIALWAQRYLIETGHAPDDLGAIPIAQRTYAMQNPRAVVRTPLTRDEYLASPRIVDPFRLPDCTIEVDGACAVLMTSADRARDLRHDPVRILGGRYVCGPRAGLDPGDASLWDDLTRNYTSLLADDLWGEAGVAPGDVHMAQLYDCFSSSVVLAMEGLGLVDRGGAIEMVRSGATGKDGRLPVNTNGGLLSEGYLHGMNTLAEAVLQLQQRGATRPARAPETCVVTSGAMMDGSALVLARS
jgi:acetyl-CoA acetyltransferase